MSGIIKVLTVILTLISPLASEIITTTPVRKCSNDAQLPLAVQVNGCTEMPCDILKGYDTNMLIQFVANRDGMTQLNADIQLTTLGVEIPFTLDKKRSDVCINLMYDAYCPLYKGEDVTYHLVFSVADHQPEVPIKMEVSLVDGKDKNIVSCFVVDARIRKR